MRAWRLKCEHDVIGRMEHRVVHVRKVHDIYTSYRRNRESASDLKCDPDYNPSCMEAYTSAIVICISSTLHQLYIYIYRTGYVVLRDIIYCSHCNSYKSYSIRFK